MARTREAEPGLVECEEDKAGVIESAAAGPAEHLEQFIGLVKAIEDFWLTVVRLPN